MILRYNFILLILVFYFPLNGYCQDMDQSGIYNLFDAKIGIENTGLYNGIAYNELHRIDINNNKFLFSKGFQAGSIIYDGQAYYDIPMNYNIYDDVVLVKLESGVGTNVIQLISEKVQSFKVLNTEFVRIAGKPEKNISPGFYEVLLENNEEANIKLLKKHLLAEKVKLDKKVSVYSYKEKDSEYVIQKPDGFFLLGGKRDFETVFPDHKDEISHYYRNFRSLRKSNPDKFMIDLTNLAILQNQ